MVSKLFRLIKRLFVPFVLYGGLVTFLISTNPNKLAIGWLLLPFVWLFITLEWTAMAIFKHMNGRYKPRRPRTVAIALAALPTIALLLDSINQLTIRDGILIVVFGLVGAFYISKFNFSHRD